MEGHISKRKKRWIRRGNQQGTYYHLMNKRGEGSGDDAETSSNVSDESLGQVSAVCEDQNSELDIFESADEFDEADSRSCQGEELDDAFMQELLSSEPKSQVNFNEESANKRKRMRPPRMGGTAAAVLRQSYMEEKKMLGDVTKEYLNSVQDSDGKQVDRKFEIVKIPEKNLQFDCESMLSSFSNTNNRPSVIVPEHRSITSCSRSDRTHATENTQLDFSGLNEIPIKHPQESKDEKKERRKLVKSTQAEKRRKKKSLSEMYKNERLRQNFNQARVGSGVRNFKLS
ncbi:hypothetical protein XU18_3064 [Perkinsela sp. CCAP 1560/4]|nr:hypothetical protein XU18_3188 [Perkinsela sp. CCAP 1560/4]KNH06007.1 hypothetical protein XU18_3064 [Perkinsela sp. CCAP 1560/4]|eukprot:KNH05911.1 hypothetical protein XU18_3188 [Perkinsela sp. CCAP 1560/4]